MRLIDADALKKDMEFYAPWVDTSPIIDAAPTIEAVPVVRCKDCKWYKEGEHLAPNRFCFRLKDANGKHIGYNFSDNDYCSHGERKDEHETD